MNRAKMKTDRKKPVMVTGITGYLGSWIVKYLLDEGMTVHGTVAVAMLAVSRLRLC